MKSWLFRSCDLERLAGIHTAPMEYNSIKTVFLRLASLKGEGFLLLFLSFICVRLSDARVGQL